MGLCDRCALTYKGALYAWGCGLAGQLGLGPRHGFFLSDAMLRNILVLVIPSGVHLVTCSHSYSSITTKDGSTDNVIIPMVSVKCTLSLIPFPCWLLVCIVKNCKTYFGSEMVVCFYVHFLNKTSQVHWRRKLAAGGDHSAVLTDGCFLKELCAF